MEGFIGESGGGRGALRLSACVPGYDVASCRSNPQRERAEGPLGGHCCREGVSELEANEES